MDNMIFSFTNTDLEILNQYQSVEFFRKLLWVESRRVGINWNLVHIPECINVADGGIDAYIKDVTPSSDDVIPNGSTVYQIKAGDLEPAECKKELYKKNSKELKPELKLALDSGANYILVIFKSITKPQIDNRIISIKEEFQKLGYENEIRIYSVSQLIGFADNHFSLIAEYKKITYCIPYHIWGMHSPITEPVVFFADESRKQIIDEIRTYIQQDPEQTNIFRITGLPGIGKTRLIYEILNIEGIKQSVVYFSEANNLINSPLFHTLQGNTEINAVIVIDECSISQHNRIVDTFAYARSKISIFTLSYEKERISEPTRLYDLQPIEYSINKKIIDTEFPNLPPGTSDRLTKFSDGYPRIGILLGKSFLEDKPTHEDIIQINDDYLFRRLLNLSDQLNRDDNLLLQILSTIAIFEKIGFRGPVKYESDWIRNKLQIQPFEYNQIVNHQKKRGIIQGDNYIYITPLMLRVYLINIWWENNGFETETEFSSFFEDFPMKNRQNIVHRFFINIPLAASNDRGLYFSTKILNSDLFTSNNGEFLQTDIGSSFFLYLAKANPMQAMVLLNNTIGKWEYDQLEHFYLGRRNIIWALEVIVANKDLFIEGSKLLLKLAEAENERISNNATGVFSELFTPIHGFFSMTEAPPEIRLPILKDTLNSENPKYRLIGLQACDAGLRTRGFSKSVSRNPSDLRITEKIWEAETYGEIFNAYKEIWDLLVVFIRESDSKEEIDEALKVLIKHSREIADINYLSDMVIDTFEEFSQINEFRKILLAQVIHIIRYKNTYKDPETKVRWEKLETQLSGSSYSELLHRYIGMNLIEEHFDSSGERTNKYETEVKKLVKYSVENIEEFTNQLEWLFSKEANNNQYFGMLLYKEDNSLSLLSLLVEKITKYDNLGLLGGYLREIHNDNELKWEKSLKYIIEDPKKVNFLPEITYWSGVSDNIILQIIDLCKKRKIDSENLHFIGTLYEIRNISYEVFVSWIELLLSYDSFHKTIIAIHDMFTFFIHAKKNHSLPKDITYSILTSIAILSSENRDFLIREMDIYYWIQLSQLFINQYPDSQIDFAKVLLHVFGSGNGLFALSISKPTQILGIIIENNKKEVWDLITNYLEEDQGYKQRILIDWLRGEDHYFGQPEHPGIISRIPIELIWEWVDADITKRAPIIAQMAPRSLSKSEYNACFAREVLIRYGEIELVRDYIMNIFLTGSWAGNESDYYQNKINILTEFLKDETNHNIILWASKYRNHLDKYLERAKINEERDYYN